MKMKGNLCEMALAVAKITFEFCMQFRFEMFLESSVISLHKLHIWKRSIISVAQAPDPFVIRTTTLSVIKRNTIACDKTNVCVCVINAIKLLYARVFPIFINIIITIITIVVARTTSIHNIYVIYFRLKMYISMPHLPFFSIITGLQLCHFLNFLFCFFVKWALLCITLCSGWWSYIVIFFLSFSF